MSQPVYQTIILGGGFTGLFTALHLSHEHYPRSVILIDQNERFCFKPLLYEYFSGEMDANQVVPRYAELLHRSGVIFVQDSVQSIDLQQQQIQLTGGDSYRYSNLVLALGSVTGFFGVQGAQEYALPFRTQQDAIAIDHHLRDRFQRAIQLTDPQQRRRLLTIGVVGGGPSGVEMAGTLADLLPQWYQALGGPAQEVRVVLVSHSDILEGDINHRLQEDAKQALHQRSVPVELVTGAKVTAVHADALEYSQNDRPQRLETSTVIWTAGTNLHPLIKSLPISDEHRDRHGRLHVTPTLQLPDFPEVFAGGDCAVELQPHDHPADGYEQPERQSHQSTSAEEQHPDTKPLPPTAQVAYQQGAAIAYNLRALALGYDPKPAKVNLRGTLLKLGLEDSIANLFNKVEVTGELGHLIRQGAYLELLPTPIHNFKATTEWLREEVFQHHSGGVDKAVKVAEVVGGVVVGAIVTKKLIQALGNNSNHQS